jgi:hypothetical protein
MVVCVRWAVVCNPAGPRYAGGQITLGEQFRGVLEYDLYWPREGRAALRRPNP